MELKLEAPTLLSIEAGLATALTFDDILLVPRIRTSSRPRSTSAPG